MNKKQYATISISARTYEMIKENIAKSGKRLSISSFVDNILLDRLEIIELMNHYGPFLTYAGRNGDVIYVDDWMQKRIASIKLSVKDDSFSLYCDLDQSENCIHIGFVYGLSEFYRMLKDNGVKTQKP